MEKAKDNPRNIATIFIENSEELLKLYCRLKFTLFKFSKVLKVILKVFCALSLELALVRQKTQVHLSYLPFEKMQGKK